MKVPDVKVGCSTGYMNIEYGFGSYSIVQHEHRDAYH